jgi:hypothetical protein
VRHSAKPESLKPLFYAIPIEGYIDLKDEKSANDKKEVITSKFDFEPQTLEPQILMAGKLLTLGDIMNDDNGLIAEVFAELHVDREPTTQNLEAALNSFVQAIYKDLTVDSLMQICTEMFTVEAKVTCNDERTDAAQFLEKSLGKGIRVGESIRACVVED